MDICLPFDFSVLLSTEVSDNTPDYESSWTVHIYHPKEPGLDPVSDVVEIVSDSSHYDIQDGSGWTHNWRRESRTEEKLSVPQLPMLTVHKKWHQFFVLFSTKLLLEYLWTCVLKKSKDWIIKMGHSWMQWFKFEGKSTF